MWVNCIEAGVVQGVADGGMSGPRGAYRLVVGFSALYTALCESLFSSFERVFMNRAVMTIG